MAYYKRNGNIIGDPKNVTGSSASGIWDLDNSNKLIQDFAWPGSDATYYDALTSTTGLPSFLTRYSTSNKSLSSSNVGYTSNGFYINGDTGAGVFAYPIRTNINIPGAHGFKLRVSIYRNEQCDDHGFCIFRTGVTPYWNWATNTSRWALQNDCAQPKVFPPSGSVQNSGTNLNPTSGTLYAQWYSVEIYMPTSSSSISIKYYSGYNTFTGTPTISMLASNPFSSLSITSTSTYNIGFDADQDNTSYQPKFKEMTINHSAVV
jgi:hypothetical protein